jgi:hypothetical protein
MEWYKDGLYPEWHISGENFSPKNLKKKYPKLLITAQHENHDKGKRGRFKNKEYGYGSCTIVVKDEIIYKLEWLLNFILENQASIRNTGVTDELIWLVWWGNQGNMELSSEQIMKIQKTGNHLNMNYYFIDDEPTAFSK